MLNAVVENLQTDVAEAADGRASLRSKIVALESQMLAEPQVEIETTHYFAPGVYMRQVRIPKGTLVTGKIHKTEHMNILSQGQMLVWTDEGMKRLTASTVIKSKPGIKRVGYAEEDSVWITVHPNVTDEQDVGSLEAQLVVDRFEELPESILKQLTQGGE